MLVAELAIKIHMAPLEIVILQEHRVVAVLAQHLLAMAVQVQAAVAVAML
jgi:hypothetical protein